MEKILEYIGEITTIINKLKSQITPNYYSHEIYSDEFSKKNLDILNKSVKIINDIYQNRINELEIELKELENEKRMEEERIRVEREKLRVESERLLESEKSKGSKTINELYNQVTNIHQLDVLEKIMYDTEDNKIYLSNYVPNTDLKKRDLIGTIKVYGTFNHKKQEREAYDIKIFDSLKETFWCSCMYHKFQSGKHNTVCKHICFVVCKILKYLNSNFFENRKLNEEQRIKLINKLTSNNMVEIDKSLIKEFKKVTLDLFKQFTKQLDPEDCCPICFDSFDIKTKVACPACHNYIHSECVEVILETRNTCLWCMDDVWSKYKKLVKDVVV